MNTNTKYRLDQARRDLRMWSQQLYRKWERLEQIALEMDLQRDVLVPVKFEEVEDAGGSNTACTTLLGLRNMDGGWQIAMGIGPDDAPYWDERWVWRPRSEWGREVCVLAATKIDHFVDALTAAAEETTAEVEEAAAAVSESIQRLA